MKAAILYKANTPLEVVDVEQQGPQAGEARVRVMATGVCPAEMLVPISTDMPWPQAALIGCAVPTGVGAVTRCAQVEAGASVVVIGCGGVGLNVVQGARLAGARMIIACDLLENKLAFAREFGATHTLNAKEGDVAERVPKP